MGAAIDRPADALGGSYVLTQPPSSGLQLRSLHMLSDYYVSGGFRATMGLVSGASAQAWWVQDNGPSRLGWSLQTVDSLSGLVDGPAARAGAWSSTSGLHANNWHLSNPYLGAGYSTQPASASSAWQGWRFDADVGVSNPVDGSGLRWSEILKISLGYAF